MRLDLGGDPVELCAALVDVPSVSGTEQELADALERALRITVRIQPRVDRSPVHQPQTGLNSLFGQPDQSRHRMRFRNVTSWIPV